MMDPIKQLLDTIREMLNIPRDQWRHIVIEAWVKEDRVDGIKVYVDGGRRLGNEEKVGQDVLERKIRDELEKHDGLCMDNPDERMRLAAALAREIA